MPHFTLHVPIIPKDSSDLNLRLGIRPDKPIAFLCNPPYRSDEDQRADSISYKIHPSVIESVGMDACNERYCCFLAQMKNICEAAEDSGLPEDSLLLLFTKSAWLTKRPVFEKIRREMMGSFEDIGGILVSAREFFDVNGNFPIAFTMWRYKGRNAGLDSNRAVSLLDLTDLKRKYLAEIDWDSPNGYDDACKAIVSSAPSALLGAERKSIRVALGQKMTDFKRDRRRDEIESCTCGGLPAGNEKRGNKKTYGESLAVGVGFMDNLTPCRTDKSTPGLPWFRLDVLAMDCRKSRCFSGSADNRGFCARDLASAKKTFSWFAISKSFAELGYPLWMDAEEIWEPTPKSEADAKKLVKFAFALGYADNECVDIVFPGNNPVRGAPEVHVSNPMTPLVPDSFWKKVMKPEIDFRLNDSPTMLIRAVDDVFMAWKSELNVRPEVSVNFKAPYFVGKKKILPLGAGLVQIRKYAEHYQCAPLLAAFEKLKEQLKVTRKLFKSFLEDKAGLDYFGKVSNVAAVANSVPSNNKRNNFQAVLNARLVLAAAIVENLREDKNLGRTKLAKIFYLADTACSLDLRTKYTREAAGPLDHRALYNDKVGVESLASKAKCFDTEERENRSVLYIPREKLSQIAAAGASEFGDSWDKIVEIIQVMKALDTRRAEVVATLYACWNDLIIENKSANDKDIINAFRNKWHPRKARFDEKFLRNALEWMRKNPILVPSGSGQKTTQKPPKEEHPF